MRKFSLALAALVATAPAVAPAEELAPAAKRKPATSAPATSPGPAVRAGSEREFQVALTAAAQGGSDGALDTSLIRVMSRLLAAGQCSEAASLANRDGRKELASRAQQLCK